MPVGPSRRPKQRNRLGPPAPAARTLPDDPKPTPTVSSFRSRAGFSPSRRKLRARPDPTRCRRSGRTASPWQVHRPRRALRSREERPGGTRSRSRSAAGRNHDECTSELFVLRVFVGVLVVVFVLFFVHRFEFDGVGGDHLEVSPALRARDHFAFIDLFFVDVEIGLAFWAVHHASLRDQGILYI